MSSEYANPHCEIVDCSMGNNAWGEAFQRASTWDVVMAFGGAVVAVPLIGLLIYQGREERRRKREIWRVRRPSVDQSEEELVTAQAILKGIETYDHIETFFGKNEDESKTLQYLRDNNKYHYLLYGVAGLIGIATAAYIFTPKTFDKAKDAVTPLIGTTATVLIGVSNMQAKRNKTLAQEERLRAGDLDKGDGEKPLPIVRVGSETHAKDLVRIGDLLKELDVETILGRSRGTDPELNAQKEELVTLRAQMEMLKAPTGGTAQPTMNGPKDIGLTQPDSPAGTLLDDVLKEDAVTAPDGTRTTFNAEKQEETFIAPDGVSTTFNAEKQVVSITGPDGAPIEFEGLQKNEAASSEEEPKPQETPSQVFANITHPGA